MDFQLASQASGLGRREVLIQSGWGISVYIVHLTETCDDNLPHLILHVGTASATMQDVELAETIHQALERKMLHSPEYFIDTSYVHEDHIVNTQTCYE